MNTSYKITGLSTKFFCLVAIAAILCNIAVWLNWDTVFIMNDGIQYLSTASNWLMGQGFSTNALIYNPHFQGQLPAPQTVWPTGIPMLLVLANSIGLELQSAALLINTSANTLSGLLVYLILRRCHISPLPALISATAFYFTTISWHLALALLSEPVFTCLVFAAVYWLPSTTKHGAGTWFLCGALISASILVRYSGAFTATAFGVGLTIMLFFGQGFRSLTAWQKCSRLGLYAAPAVITFAGLMFRNQYLVGSIDRDTGVGVYRSIAETVRLFAQQSAALTGFRDGWLYPDNIDTLLFIVFLALVAIVAMLSVLVCRSDSDSESLSFTDHQPALHNDHYRAAIVTVLVAHTAAFGGYLAYCSLSSSPLNITPRYLFQIYPGVFVVFCLLVGSAFTVGRRTTLKRLLVYATGCLTLLYLVAQVNLIPVINQYSVRAADARDTLQLAADGDRTMLDVIRVCVGDVATPNDDPTTSLWSNEGIPLHYNSGVHTITQAAIYTTSDFNFERFKSDIDEYKIGLFIFINNYASTSGDFGIMLSSIKDWLKQNEYPELILPNATLPSGNTVTVYRNPECELN